MITKFNKFNLIKETPDTIHYKNKRGNSKSINYYAKDAKPFFVETNSDHTKVIKLFIGFYKSPHMDIRYPYGREDQKKYAGRIWKRRKLISFWIYPNKTLFVDIIKELEKKLKTKIFNNDWKIEIIKTSDQKFKMADPNDKNIDFYFGDRYDNKQNQEELIPIEDYIDSEDQPEELRIQHMLNWQEKEKEKKKNGVKGFGSDKTAWDSPHNIKYRQTIYQENKNNK